MKESLKLEAEDIEKRWEKEEIAEQILLNTNLKTALIIYNLICE